MGGDFEKLLHLAQGTKTDIFAVEQLWQRLINELESDSDLTIPVEFMQEAFTCVDQHGMFDERLRQATVNFVQRTGIGDYAVTFNNLCEGSRQDLYIELPESTICQPSTEEQIQNAKAYGLYYVRKRLSELWASSEVSPHHVASLLADYLTDFRKARASDEHIAGILSDMLDYGYLDELCHVAGASRTRGACHATTEARKVVAAEQALARSMDVSEYTLVSFLTENLSEHKTLCLREYNKKKQRRQALEIAELQQRQNEDRDEYGQIQRRRTLASARPQTAKPDTSDLTVLKRPYWLYCEKGEVHYWVGDHAYGAFIISYTSEAARKLRFNDNRAWKRADLDIVHGRLQSFTWHSAVENFIEVQQATGVKPSHPSVKNQKPEATEEAPVPTTGPAASPQETTKSAQSQASLLPPQITDTNPIPAPSTSPVASERPILSTSVSPSALAPESTHRPIEATGQSSEPSPPTTAELIGTQPVKRHVGYTLESIADRLRQEQDRVMRTSPVGITLIAGTAGSGKTNVAFHRIDYLLQEHSDRFSQRNIAVFAPKTSLAKYLRELANSFQFQSLPVYSYDDWAMGILCNFTDANRAAAEEDPEISRRKSSVVMVDLMRRYLSDKIYQLEAEIDADSRLQEYAEIIDSVFRQAPTSLIGLYTALRDALWSTIDTRHELDGPDIIASRTLIESSLTTTLQTQLNQTSLMDDLESLLAEKFCAFPGFKKEYGAVKIRLEVYRQPPSWLQRQMWSRGASERRATIEAILTEFVELMFSEKRIEQLVLRRVRSEKNRVNARLRAVFKRVCFVSIYARPPARLASVCETPFLLHIFPMLTEFYRSRPVWEYLGLAETPEHRFEVFELSRTDLDVAMWLLYQMSSEHLAEEPTPSFLHVYDHVVVDEAQDFTPLQLLLFHRLSRNSMTLAGDLTQRIFDMGIQAWSELGEPIDNTYVLTMSHRTTLETALFANALMRTASSVTLAERVAYHGDRPLIIQCQDDDSAIAAAIDQVRKIKAAHPGASILLVHPKNAALRELRDKLAVMSIAGYVAKGDTWEFSEKVTVTTYRRVQGLEYDYVIILGLNEFETMPISGDKPRILYTLVTRAKEQVVFCVRDPFPTLLSGIDSSLYDLK